MLAVDFMHYCSIFHSTSDDSWVVLYCSKKDLLAVQLWLKRYSCTKLRWIIGFT